MIDGGPATTDPRRRWRGPAGRRPGHGRCQGAKERTCSCGREAPPKASAYIQLDPAAAGGAGLQIVGGGGHDKIGVAFDEDVSTFWVTAAKGIAVGPGCTRQRPNQVTCAAGGPARWLTADLGPGNDSLAVEGSLAGSSSVRFAGGAGNDTIQGGPRTT